MGHMISRRWVEVVCDLQGGKLELDGEGSGGGHPDVRGRLRALGERFQERWGRREGCKGEVLEMVLVGFYGVCAGYC